TQLIANCEFHNTDPSLATATAVLNNISFSRPKLKSLTPRIVIEKTAGYFDLRPEDITGPKRDKEIVVPRQIAIYLMRHEMSLSFPKIARAVGGRDHTTAIHSVVKIEKLLEADENLRHELNAIKEQLFI
ncbi:MAG TPA: helix-turn-helix domain-containing protein, partial [Candidatus Saccharimonadales bacterium]|nr:helix-turn-helix domain-containing protein [Candidatus Saccharimonadales bacterium]